MCPRLTTLVACALAVVSFQPLMAAPDSSIEKTLQRDFMRNSHITPAVRKERSPQEIRFQPTYSEAVAARLGVVDGKARIFRYYPDGPSPTGRTFEGAFGGNGVKLRLSW